MRYRDKKLRVSDEFEKEIRRIARLKIENGTARAHKKETFSARRLTLAMTRHPLFKDIEEDIANADLD